MSAVKKIAAALIILLALYALLALIPYPELARFRQRDYGPVLTDRNGIALRAFPATDGVRREWAGLEETPPGALRVFLRAEDRRFYLHPGVDPLAVLSSALRNLRAGRVVSGASTITMQLARLIRPRRGGLRGKAAEAFDALRLEARLSKREILELWLNGIPFGSNIEGLAAMSRARFGLPLRQLDDRRALLLAVVPRRPARFDPALNPEAAVSAALALARRCGLETSEGELREAALEAASGTGGAVFLAPHFTDRVKETVSTSTRTTLDLSMQTLAEGLLRTELAALEGHRVSNGAVLVIENASGAVRVYAGSVSWFDDQAGGKIDGVRTRGQPGSCLKPFLYALALDRGFSPGDILPDLPTVFGGPEAYAPANFNNRFNGPVRFRVALASSLNVPAVYLIERLGVGAFEDYLAALGFDSIAEARGSLGTGLALGNAEVSLEELARAFSAFPRGGVPAELRLVEDALPAESSGRTSPMSGAAAWTIADILSDKSSRFVGFGPAPAFSLPFPAMFKTGTANQFQHIWALGASNRYTVGVWMGNFSGATVIGRTGSSIPARIVNRLLSALEEGDEAGGMLGAPPPPELMEAEVCALSGMAKTPFCPGGVREWLRERPAPCAWHQGGETLYPPEYRAWLAERFRLGAARREGRGLIRLPVPGAVFYLDPSLPPEAQAIRVETSGFADAAAVYLDGAIQGSLNPAGVWTLPLEKGRHEVQVEDGESSASTVFVVK